VPATCTVSASSSFGTPSLAASGSVTAQALVNCNAAFKITAQSRNGRLANPEAAPAGFANAVPYELTFSVPLDNSSTPASATCASSTLTSGQAGCALSPGNAGGLSSGGKPSINKTATLTVAYAVPAAPTRLVAGSYTDTITLTIATAQ
jgi:hypothetical protein